MSGSGHLPTEQVGQRGHARSTDEVSVTRTEAGRVARFGHGSRVPGWDDSVDLEKDPVGVPDPATTPVPADLRAEMEAHIAKYPDRRSAALPCLAAAQRVHGWCSPEAVAQVATVMRLTPAYLTAVATFYDMFDTQPVGRHRVYLCTNISCMLNGAGALYERMVEHLGDDPDVHFRGFECLGACDIAPMASVDGIYVGPIELDEVPQLVDDIHAGRAPLPAKQLAGRRSVDPNAGGTPTAPTAFGMPGGEQPSMGGTTAAYEQAPDPPDGPDRA